jgi:hypothetical protein
MLFLSSHSRHASKICGMITTVRELFEAFADHCAEQSVAGRSTNAVFRAVKAEAAATSPGRTVSPMSTQELSQSAEGVDPTVAETGVKGASTDLVPGTAVGGTRPRSSYNYVGLLQRVIMLLREARHQVQSAVKLHDVASVLDRCRRGNKIEQAALDDLFRYLREMIVSREGTERKYYHVPTATPVGFAGHSGNGSYKSLPPVTNKERVKSEGIAGVALLPVSANKRKRPSESGSKRAPAGKLKKARRSGDAEDEDDDTDSLSGDSARVIMVSSKSKPAQSGARGRQGKAKYSSLKEPLSDEDIEAPPAPAAGTNSKFALPQAQLELLLKRGLAAIRKVEYSSDFEGEVRPATVLLVLCTYDELVNATTAFLLQITDDVLPGYTSIVKKPMNLLRIEARLGSHDYRTVEQFDADVRLMISNCAKYWGKNPTSPYPAVSS